MIAAENQTILAFYDAIEKYLKRDSITSVEIEVLARAYNILDNRAMDGLDCMSKSLLEAIKLTSLKPKHEETPEADDGNV